MLWLIVAAFTTTAAADSFQLANGSHVEGTLATYELGGNCQIFVSSGQVRGATLLLPCDEIVAFNRPGAEPVDAAAVDAAAAPAVVAAVAPATPDAVQPDAHEAPPTPVVLVPEVVEARDPVVMSSEPAVQAVSAEQLPAAAVPAAEAPAEAAIVAAAAPAAPAVAAPAAGVAMAAPHPEPVAASLPEGYTLPAARVAPDAMAEAAPAPAQPIEDVAVDGGPDATAPENLRGTPRATERLDAPAAGSDAQYLDDDLDDDASEEASAEPEGWRAREDRSGGSSMPRWLYKAIYGEAPPDSSTQPERDDAGSSGQDT